MSSFRIAGGGGLGALVITLVMLGTMGPGCTQLGLRTASTALHGPPQGAAPLLAPYQDDEAVLDLVDWAERREIIKAALEAHVYGPYPHGPVGQLVSRDVLDTAFANNSGVLEELTVSIGEGDAAVLFRVAVAYPHYAAAGQPAPLILAENFCGNQLAMGADRDVVSPPLGEARACPENWFFNGLAQLIFGKHTATPPLEKILRRGYAIAEIFPSEVAPDHREKAIGALERIGQLTPPENAPNSVLAAWAATFGWALDAMADDVRIDADKIVVWGHSRHGKAALLAAAHDDRIDGVISHQSGTGGATLTTSLNGESVKQITKSYPHWFAPAYADYADREAEIPVEQHQLLALIAPRPVLLGNGWKDVWSDPNGAFRAAMAADPAWELMGRQGLAQTGLDDPDYLTGELGFQIRKGAHGVRKADWRAFLDWMDVWFSPPMTDQTLPIMADKSCPVEETEPC